MGVGREVTPQEIFGGLQLGPAPATVISASLDLAPTRQDVQQVLAQSMNHNHGFMQWVAKASDSLPAEDQFDFHFEVIQVLHRHLAKTGVRAGSVPTPPLPQF